MFVEARAAKGLGDEPFDFTCVRHVFVGEDDKTAIKEGTEAVEYYFKSTALFRPIGGHERDAMIYGGPETCVDKLRELREETGVNHLICWMNFGGMDNKKVLRSMRLFADEVMPVLRADAEAVQSAAQ